MSEGVIRLEGVGKTYAAGETRVEALKPTDLAIRRGEFVALMGPSGSGKSTMLNLLGLLDRPTRGVYRLEGTDVSALNDDATSAIRCRRIGIVFQSFNLFPQFDVLENVAVPMRYAQRPEGEIRERAAALLDRLGMAERARHRPSQLSGGQRQRVAIARALANDPAFLLADEPTGNLDEKTGEEVLEIFHELHDEGRTLVMVTHNPVYASHVERVIELHDGRVRPAGAGGGATDRFTP